MKKDFPFVKVPEKMITFVGENDPGTRQFRCYGTEAGYRMWFDVVSRICKPEGMLTPSGAALYIGVSRAGLHKRLKEGRLTVFLFHKLDESRMFKSKDFFMAFQLLKERSRRENAPFPANAFIPVSECKAWAAELEGRTIDEFERRGFNATDWWEESLKTSASRKWKKKKTKG